METPAENFFKVNCPNCFQHIECPHELSGQTIDCPTCNKPFRAELINAPDYPPNPESQVSLSESLPESLPQIRDELLRSIKVRSSSSERYYTVNLIDYTCTCPSFLEVHSKSPPYDFGRLCKHLCASLKRPEMLRLLSPIGLAIVQEGFGVYPGRFNRDRNGNLIYITGVNNSGWINVYALKRKDGKTYYRFGYSVNEQKWAFGTSPALSEEILNSPKKVETSLNPSNKSHQILGVNLRGIGKAIMVLIRGVVYIFGVFVVVFLRLAVSGMKPKRRSGKWWEFMNKLSFPFTEEKIRA